MQIHLLFRCHSIRCVHVDLTSFNLHFENITIHFNDTSLHQLRQKLNETSNELKEKTHLF